MPMTAGRYADAEPAGFRRRWFWLRHNATQPMPRRHDPRDEGGGFVMHREWGAWVLRPVSGWRSVRWVTPPIHAAWSVPRTNRDAVSDPFLARRGI